MSRFDDDLQTPLDTMPLTWDIMYDAKPKSRRYSKRSPGFGMDADMYQAIQDLLANKSLPYGGDIGAMGRDAWAHLINSLDTYLTSDARTVWQALQSAQRRLTAERYVVLVETQVKESVDLLASWTDTQEWGAVAGDLEYALAHIADFPPAWKRRVAAEWLGNYHAQQLMQVWAEDMALSDPAAYERVVRVWREFQSLVEARA